MNRKNPNRSTHATFAPLSSAILGLTLGLCASAQALAGSHTSVADAAWLWDPSDIVGESKLVRTENGISATYRSLGLTPGDAVTMWFIVFNNPAACEGPCDAPDLFNPAVQGDFLLAGGHVIGASGMANFGGHLSVGDASGSGHIEIGNSAGAVGLINPYGAEVRLALHSHGPAQRGKTLKSQLSSFLGGCTVFPLNGDAFGGAEGPGDLPDAVGECSTVQYSVHMP